MQVGMFNYMTIDLKPTVSGQIWILNIISRVSPGDNFNSAQVRLGDGVNFGPASVAGQWATYRIPFLPASGYADGTSLQMGFGTFTGSISGTTLTVSSMSSGLNIQGSSYLSGGDIIQGTSSTTATYIADTSGTSGGPGTYTVAPSQSVGSTVITAQRTNMYKFSLIEPDQDGNTYYVDNIGFTVE
jgi:hypothetical protein